MIKKFNDPWEHYLVDNFLPIEILKSLKNIKIESKNNLQPKQYLSNKFK